MAVGVGVVCAGGSMVPNTRMTTLCVALGVAVEAATFTVWVGDEVCVAAWREVAVAEKTGVVVCTGAVDVNGSVEVGPGGRISSRMWICALLSALLPNRSAANTFTS